MHTIILKIHPWSRVVIYSNSYKYSQTLKKYRVQGPAVGGILPAIIWLIL